MCVCMISGSVLAPGSFGLFLKYMVSSPTGTYFPLLGVAKGKRVVWFRGHLDSHSQQLKRGLSCPMLGFSSIAHRSIVSPDEKSSLKLHMYIYTQIYMYYFCYC